MYGVFDPPVLPDGFRKQGDILFQTGNKKSSLDGGFTPDRSLAYSPTYRCLLYVTNAISLAVGDQVADSIRQGLQ